MRRIPHAGCKVQRRCHHYHQLRPGAVWAGLGARIPPHVTLADSLPLVDGEGELLAVSASLSSQINSGVDRLARASFSTSKTR